MVGEGSRGRVKDVVRDGDVQLLLQMREPGGGELFGGGGGEAVGDQGGGRVRVGWWVLGGGCVRVGLWVGRGGVLDSCLGRLC